LAVPELCYTNDPGQEFHNEFFRNFGSREDLQLITGTPDFNLLLNMAKAIYYTRINFKDGFGNIRHILNLNEYIGFQLTGNAGAEPTYIGSHTYLWDFQRGYWSDVAEKLGIKSFLPAEINNPWDVLGTIRMEIANTTGLDKDTIVTHGIHDSNAALLPYLISMDEDFVLNSTGTWCVVMHEEDKVNFNEDEIGKLVFFNISTFSNPVKTSIFMGGLEYDQYHEILCKMHGNNAIPEVDVALLNDIANDRTCFILPGITRGTGQFPDSEPRIIEGERIIPFEKFKSGEIIPDFMKDRKKAYAVLNFSLAVQSKVALDRSGMKDGMLLFTEGGFSKNNVYNALLTAFYPNSEIALTNLDEASAFGAAIIGKSAVEKVNPKEFRGEFEIEKKPVHRINISGIQQYQDKFLELV
jgi:L-fuculokinase